MSQTPSRSCAPHPLARGGGPLRGTARAAVRATVRGGAVGLLLVGSVGLPTAALADEPVGWESVPSVSPLDFFLVLLIAPVALGIVITLLVAVPSWLRGSSYQTGQEWGGDDEWFGGSRTGLEKGSEAKQIEAAGEQGGAGARY